MNPMDLPPKRQHTGFRSPHFDHQNPEQKKFAWERVQHWMTEIMEREKSVLDFRITTTRWDGDALSFFHATATRYK